MEFKRCDWKISRELKESVEHIFPQEPEIKDWPHYVKFEDGQLHRLKNSLGNLLILSVSSNASASRRSFKDKCNRSNSTNQTVGYANGSFSEIKVSRDYQDWNSESILKRGLLLLEFLEDKWDVELGSDEEKINLLGLTFLSNKS